VFQALIERIGKAFARSKIPYMIVGGQAVLFHGEPRLTKDIDITLGLGVERLGDIIRLVSKLGLKPLVSDVDAFVRETMVLPAGHEKSGIRVDLIFSFSPYERQAIDRAVTARIGRAEVRIAALEDLIIHKMIAGRPRDLEDIRTLILKNPIYDSAYIAKWLADFGAETGQDYSEQFKIVTRGLPES